MLMFNLNLILHYLFNLLINLVKIIYFNLSNPREDILIKSRYVNSPHCKILIPSFFYRIIFTLYVKAFYKKNVIEAYIIYFV